MTMGTAAVRAPGVNGSLTSERRILLIEDSAVLTRRLVDLLSEPEIGRASCRERV